MKILLIEDDKNQINWAKKIFANDELIVCKTGLDGEERLREIENIDLLITDLFLPFKEGEKPNFIVGIGVFVKGVELLKKEKIRKLALVSNYEHHVNIAPFEGQEENLLRSVFAVAEALSKDIFVSFDKLIWDYEFYFFKGKVYPLEEVDDDIKFLENLKEGRAVLLKDYHIIRRWAAENKE